MADPKKKTAKPEPPQPKYLAGLRFILGGLFIFSGLVKLNDPVGTAIKLEEYFEVFSEDLAAKAPALSGFFHDLIPHALTLSLIFCVLEVLLGVAVLIRYRMRFTMWVMLALILFFTFLTFYSANYNKVTDCGCFGDFMKLKPWTSFGKDVVLLVITVILFAFRNRMPNMLHRSTGDGMMALVAVGLYFIGWYATIHLPYDDWRPYYVGAHIPTQMKPSEGYQYEYVMERGGKEQTFTEYPEDTTWHYKSMELLNPEAGPKITDYRVWNDEADYTDSTFRGIKLLIIVQTDQGYSEKEFEPIRKLVQTSENSHNPQIDAWVLTSLDSRRYDAFRHKVQLSAPYFYADATVLKTIMRTKVGTWLLKDGLVIGKWAFADTPTPEEIRERIAKL